MSIRYNGEVISGKYPTQTIYPASENEAGIIQIASSQEVKDGTNNTKAVTPRRLKTNYATKEELNSKQDKLISGTNIKTLNNESLLGEGNIDITSAQWGNIEGDITNQSDLQDALDEKQSLISDIENIRINAKTGADLVPQVEANTQRIEDLTTARIPDVIYHGTPKITGGQISNFSTVNYLQFPFEDISRGLPFDIYFSFTTDDDVTTQQNIIDSHFGIALAIQNGKGVMALSSNGTNWDIGTSTGINTILPNSTYYVKYSWTGTEYNASISTNDQTYVPDMVLPSNKSPFKTTIYIGGSEGLFGPNTAHPFKGIINFSKSRVDVNGITVWEGMADVGIASRANVSLTNLDEVGEKRFTDLQTAIDTKASNSDLTAHTANTTIHVTAGDKVAWSNKQNAITDLDTIRDGASKGATAIQNTNDCVHTVGDETIAGNKVFTSPIEIQRAGTDKAIKIGVGGGGNNRGIFDVTTDQWAFNLDANNKPTVLGSTLVRGTGGSSTKPVYVDTDGIVTECNTMVDTSSSQTIAGNKTFSGTMVLSKTQDASGTANNSPALIVGGAVTSCHLELDGNEIMAKTNATTVGMLTLNNEGGDVVINGSSTNKVTISGGTVTAPKFTGALTGNVTGNCSGSSGSCTGNAATATKATQDSAGNVINTTYQRQYYSRYAISTYASTNPYIKLATFSISNTTNNDMSCLFWVEALQAGVIKNYALVKLSARWSGTAYSGTKFEILEKYGDNTTVFDSLTWAYSYTTASSKGSITGEVWMKTTANNYWTYYFRPTECNEYGDYSKTPVKANTTNWTYYDKDGTSANIASTAITSGYTQVGVTDLSISNDKLVEIPVLIQSVQSGTEGYNVWSNGYCEQWGKASRTGANQVIQLTKTYGSIVYNIQISPYHTALNTDGRPPLVYDTNTDFDNFTLNIYTSYAGAYWKTSGFLAAGEY